MKRYIYLIRNDDNGALKIGIGLNPQKRIKQLSTGSTSKLTLIYERICEHASKVERNLHIDYQDFRLNGEWFELPIISIKEIDDKVTLYEKNFIALSEAGNPFL